MYQLILCFCDPLSWNVFTFCWFCDPLCCFSSPKWECVEPKLRASSRMLILCLSRINQSGHWKYTNQQFLSIKEESTNCVKWNTRKGLHVQVIFWTTVVMFPFMEVIIRAAEVVPSCHPGWKTSTRWLNSHQETSEGEKQEYFCWCLNKDIHCIFV